MEQHAESRTRRDAELSRRVRRPLAILSIVGYPIYAALSTLVPDQLIARSMSVLLGLVILALTLIAIYRLYKFREGMAQAPDIRLDERQRSVRDSAYVRSYRIFVGLTLIVLTVVALWPDWLHKAPLELTFELARWYVMGIIVISIALPSAVVAWREPDLAA